MGSLPYDPAYLKEQRIGQGARARRGSTDIAKREWYAEYRSARFAAHFGGCTHEWAITVAIVRFTISHG